MGVHAGVGLGRRITEWELKGVPLRVEIGPRDLAADAATVVRRDTGERGSVPLPRLSEVLPPMLGEEGERRLNADAVSVRCLQTADGNVPANADENGLMAIIGRAY